MKAIDVGKTLAIDAGKKLVETAAKKIIYTQVANCYGSTRRNYYESKRSAINLNKQMDRASVIQLLLMQLQFKNS